MTALHEARRCRYAAPVPFGGRTHAVHPDQLRTAKDSAERPGELIAEAADQRTAPEDLWREIAEAAVQVAAAAEMLAGDET